MTCSRPKYHLVDDGHVVLALCWPKERQVLVVEPGSRVKSMHVGGILTTNLAACVCVFVCAQNFTNFSPDALISSPNVPKILFA